MTIWCITLFGHRAGDTRGPGTRLFSWRLSRCAAPAPVALYFCLPACVVPTGHPRGRSSAITSCYCSVTHRAVLYSALLCCSRPAPGSEPSTKSVDFVCLRHALWDKTSTKQSCTFFLSFHPSPSFCSQPLFHLPGPLSSPASKSRLFAANLEGICSPIKEHVQYDFHPHADPSSRLLSRTQPVSPCFDKPAVRLDDDKNKP